jgi:hypothetical protein
MVVQRASKMTIRLNVLGPLQIEPEASDKASASPSWRVQHVLALMAVKDRYSHKELIEVLWPDEAKNYGEAKVREALGVRLHGCLSDTRKAVGLDGQSGFLKSHNRVVDRVAGGDVTVIIDFDDFHSLAGSDKRADWQAALALVRGVFANGLPDDGVERAWLTRERDRQRQDIRKVLEQLHPNATAELDDLCQDVLDQRYRPAKPVTPPLRTKDDQRHQLVAPSEQAADAPTLRGRILRRRRLIAGLLTVCIAAAGIVISVLHSHRQSATASIPPPGAVVNTWTGKWSFHTPTATAPLAQVSGGTASLRACDLTARQPCKYLFKETSIRAHMGDIIEFKDFLYNPQDEPIPYVKLTVDSGPGGSGKHEAEEIGVQFLAAWPEPHTVEYPAGNGENFTISLPTPGAYHLTYIPGSTTLTSPYNSRLLFHLPDGIMEEGIGIEDLGTPRSCFQCAPAYSRIVSYRAKIT